MNKYGVIDIGSNSIRLMVSDGVATIYKTLETTQLSQGLQLTGYLNKEAMNRSIQAIEKLYKQAINDGANQVYVFATEAVRSASNKEEFILLLKQKNIDVDIIPSQYEAKIGFYGAYTKGKVCVMDIGGASTELAIGDEKGIYYSKSLPIGIVRIKDQCGENLTEAISYIEKVIQGAKTESVPLGELKKLAEDRLLFFDEELMTFAMGNCITLEDTNGNRKLYKKRYDQKIDAVAAMMDAYIAYKLNREAFE